jgi:hypothetical protein
MAFKTSVWFVNSGTTLQLQDRVKMDSEKRLEDWIATDLSLLGEPLLLIRRQVYTNGGKLDILAMDGDGVLVIAELKRERTAREVVAQVIDYASWVRERTPRDIDELCRQTHGKSLAEAFRSQFQYDLPESACKSHRMVVVAAQLDDSSERIIRYLQDEHEIDINAVFFSVYQVAGQEMLVRAWLADPVETQQRATAREQTPWTGMWYVNTGIDNSGNNRDWEVCRNNGFISAGGGEKYSNQLYKLHAGDRIAAYLTGSGYVGVGTVRTEAIPADEFTLANGQPLSTVSELKGSSEQEDGEHVIGVDWIKTVPQQDAKKFTGIFANQNVVCKLRHAPTLEFVERELGA